ncbi:hypothetical protein Pan54_53140 [Rubinisphaera italica]|uniref:Uncharacterized protein n=1 Tax=Rubinisphaera italica TaxID=2527969 RepID=A0A5C5XPP0_9PLAN|nr:hypothetical protein Pan54_53140 [Rubinisphaera italica]
MITGTSHTIPNILIWGELLCFQKSGGKYLWLRHSENSARYSELPGNDVVYDEGTIWGLRMASTPAPVVAMKHA